MINGTIQGVLFANQSPAWVIVNFFMCFLAWPENPCCALLSSQLLTNFRVYNVLNDNGSCHIGLVSCADPPGGPGGHERSHSEPMWCVWGGYRELLSLRQ